MLSIEDLSNTLTFQSIFSVTNFIKSKIDLLDLRIFQSLLTFRIKRVPNELATLDYVTISTLYGMFFFSILL